jgi:excisionase family DNA binding protein
MARCNEDILVNPNCRNVALNVISSLSDELPRIVEVPSKCEPLLDSNEAARLLRIHPKTLQRMARKGEIPALQIGKLWRFSSSALLLWQQQKLAG